MRLVLAFPIALILKSWAVITNEWQGWGVAIILTVYIIYAITLDILHFKLQNGVGRE